jgi:hypothetical protein
MLSKEDFFRFYCCSCLGCRAYSALNFCYRGYLVSPEAFNVSIFTKIKMNRGDLLSIIQGDYSIKNIRKRKVFKMVFCDNLNCPRCFADDIDIDLCAYDFGGKTINQEEQYDEVEDEKNEICLILSDNDDFKKEFYKIIEDNNKQRDKDN